MNYAEQCKLTDRQTRLTRHTGQLVKPTFSKSKWKLTVKTQDRESARSQDLKRIMKDIRKNLKKVSIVRIFVSQS